MTKSANPHWGSTLDDFLEEEGIREEVTTAAIKQVIAWQLAEGDEERRITKKRLAELIHTSRAQIDRILEPRQRERHDRNAPGAPPPLLGRQLRLEFGVTSSSGGFHFTQPASTPLCSLNGARRRRNLGKRHNGEIAMSVFFCDISLRSRDPDEPQSRLHPLGAERRCAPLRRDPRGAFPLLEPGRIAGRPPRLSRADRAADHDLEPGRA